jgi:hypothetical protein
MTRLVPLVLAVSLALDSQATAVDATGARRQPLAAPPGGLAAAFFVAHDCPISNHYAQEIRRICEEYAARGVRCTLVHVDPSPTDAAALAHAREYRHGDYPVVVDRRHTLVRAAGVRITPEVAVVDERGHLAYRGRIDDFFAGWGQSRRVVRDRSLRNALDALLAGRAAAHPRTDAVGCYISDLAR